jgi:hypothetical protein
MQKARLLFARHECCISPMRIFRTSGREMSKTYAMVVCGILCMLADPGVMRAQATSATDMPRAQAASGTDMPRAHFVLGDANQPSCSAVLANDSTAGTRIDPTDSASRAGDTSAVARSDTGSFGVGGARKGRGDVILLVGIHADEVRFAKQPHVRVRLCWGGDTLRVVQRDNLPSPIVPGTTYRNVYIAVELVGRLNAECLADKLGVGNASPQSARATNSAVAGTPVAATPASSCAFLGGSAATGTQNPRPSP